MAAGSSSEYKRTARAFVRNLPPSTTGETLLAHFSFYSDIIDAKVFLHPRTGEPSGCGMLVFPANHKDDVMAVLTAQKFFVVNGVEVEVVPFEVIRDMLPVSSAKKS